MNIRFRFPWGLLSHYKYLIVIVLGVMIIGVVGDSCVVRLVQYDLQISDLESEISRYNAQNEYNSQKLKELKLHPKAIEKIARERYFMKADDEDIFVLSDDEKLTTNDETTE